MGDGALAGIADIIKSLDDLSDGWFIVHKSKRLARADATYSQLYIEQMRENGIELSDAEAKAFMLTNARNVRSSENLSAILDAVTIPDDAPVGDIQDEWYAAWIDGAKDAFSEWSRRVYRKALERKAADPRDLSRSTLGVIARMDEEDITTMQRLMGLQPVGDCHIRVPMVLSDDDAILGLVGLSSHQIGHMMDIGVLQRLPERQRKRIVRNSNFLKYPGNEDCLVADEDDDHIVKGFSFPVRFEFSGAGSFVVPSVWAVEVGFIRSHTSVADYGCHVFTEAGKEICALLDPVSPSSAKGYLMQAYAALDEEEAEKGRGITSEREFDRMINASIKRYNR